MYLQLLHAILNNIQKENCLCYMMGDFNINLLNVDTHVPSSAFLECMYTMSYIPLISKPTRITATYVTLIDKIFTNNRTINRAETCSGILYSNISDLCLQQVYLMLTRLKLILSLTTQMTHILPSIQSLKSIF